MSENSTVSDRPDRQDLLHALQRVAGQVGEITYELSLTMDAQTTSELVTIAARLDHIAMKLLKSGPVQPTIN